MIKDKLENIDNYSLNEHFENFKKAILKSNKYPSKLNAPLRVIPLEYQTKDFDLSKFENHERNMDIHYIIEGTESIGINSVNNLVSNIPYNVEGDYQLFDGEVKEVIVLEKGDFLVLFPGEAHVTAGKLSNSESIRKIVYKIPLG